MSWSWGPALEGWGKTKILQLNPSVSLTRLTATKPSAQVRPVFSFTNTWSSGTGRSLESKSMVAKFEGNTYITKFSKYPMMVGLEQRIHETWELVLKLSQLCRTKVKTNFNSSSFQLRYQSLEILNKYRGLGFRVMATFLEGRLEGRLKGFRLGLAV